MDVGSVLAMTALLLMAAFTLQVCWWLILAAAFWTPPAFIGVLAAWSLWTISHHVVLSLVAALLGFIAAKVALRGTLQRMITALRRS